jgi:hypothetical protein
VLDQHARLDFHSASSLKQQFMDRHVSLSLSLPPPPLYSRHIILIPSQPVFALSPQCCVLTREATNFIVFGLTRSGFEPTIYRIRGEHVNHYTTDAVQLRKKYLIVHEASSSLKCKSVGYLLKFLFLVTVGRHLR